MKRTISSVDHQVLDVVVTFPSVPIMNETTASLVITVEAKVRMEHELAL